MNACIFLYGVQRRSIDDPIRTDRPNPPPHKQRHQNPQELHTRSLKAGLDVSDPALGEAWRRLASGDASGGESVGWVLYGYDQGGANAIKCVMAATGSGAGDLLAALREDQV